MAKQECHDMLYEMASVGYFTTFKENGKQESPKFKVFVCGDEGEIPHMHIWDDETDGKKIHTCVCLDKIEYFHHTGKEDILTPKQKKFLFDFLKEECKKTSVTKPTGNTLCLCGTTTTQARYKWMKLLKCWITRN
ncbi:MAG: hypothetical protein IKY67_14295 [Paludibacteraceae bacterium]|nr:hypothetical protein [Paludibacteraceae bacterium]